MALGAPCGVPQSWLPLRVTSTHEARTYVRAHGGTLYLTVHGFSTDPPGEPVDTDGFDGGGYLLVLDRRVTRPAGVRVDVVDGALAVTTDG
jgi:hypothetical protein